MEEVNLRYILSTFVSVTMYPQYNNMLIKKKKAWCHWLTAIILATQEAQVRKTAIQSQPWANKFLDHISKKKFTKKGW
jgi:hypothetical protein